MSENAERPRETKARPSRILVADDDPVSLRVLHRALEKWSYEVTAVKDGTEAWRVLTMAGAPPMVILDWMMPGMDGPSLCRKVRALPSDLAPYLILLTARNDRLDVVAGLEAGANDYVMKPFHHAELRARVRVGTRVLDLQNRLAERISDLETALKQVKQLRGLLPICMYCKRIRNDQDYWQQVEAYISEHSRAEFTHGICPECYNKLVKDQHPREDQRA